MHVRELAPRSIVIPVQPVFVKLVQGGNKIGLCEPINTALPKDDSDVVKKSDTGIDVRAVGLELQRRGARLLAGAKAVRDAEDGAPIISWTQNKTRHLRIRIKLRRQRPLLEPPARFSKNR